MNQRRKFLITASLLPLTACTKDTLLVPVNTKLLYDEFQNASSIVLSLPFTAEDRVKIERIVSELDTIRVKLGVLHESSPEQILLSVPEVEKYVTTIHGLYNEGRVIVLQLYASRNFVVPRALVEYDKSATYVYNALKDQIDNVEDSIALSSVVEYLGLALRVYATTQGVPIVNHDRVMIPVSEDTPTPAPELQAPPGGELHFDSVKGHTMKLYNKNGVLVKYNRQWENISSQIIATPE